MSIRAGCSRWLQNPGSQFICHVLKYLPLADYQISFVACQYPNDPVRKIWLPLRYTNEKSQKNLMLQKMVVVIRPKAKSGLLPAASLQVPYWLLGSVGMAVRKRLFSGEQGTRKLARVSCPLKGNLANSNPSLQALSHLPPVSKSFVLILLITILLDTIKTDPFPESLPVLGTLPGGLRKLGTWTQFKSWLYHLLMCGHRQVTFLCFLKCKMGIMRISTSELPWGFRFKGTLCFNWIEIVLLRSLQLMP